MGQLQEIENSCCSSSSASPGASPGAEARSCRLLIVDDHHDSHGLLARVLAPTHEVRVASSYETAVEVASQWRPDVLVSDIRLPGQDGLALMRELNRLYGIRGVAVSGHPVDEELLEDAGFVRHLLKPILLDQLIQAVTQACHARAESNAATR